MCKPLMVFLTHSSNSEIGGCDSAAADDEEVRGVPRMMMECECVALRRSCWV